MSGLQFTTAAGIAAALEGRREGRQWRCRCPIHGGRSLLVCDGDAGRILVFCHGGCETGDVLAELRRSGLLSGTSENYQLPAMRRNDCPDEAARTARALAAWRETRPANGTIVETYLANRGLVPLSPRCLRFHPDCPHPSGRRYPAMVALVEHRERGPVGVHRTYLRSDGSGKAAVETTKASLGPIAGGAVQLATIQAGRWTLIAEGIETALSVGQSCGLVVWAALSAGGIRNLVLPAEARMVLICADNDATASASATQMPLPSAFSPRAGASASHCRPGRGSISMTSCVAPHPFASTRTAMSPDPGAIRAIVEQAEEMSAEPPPPLTRQMPPADAFPVDALGDVLGAAARAIHDRVQAPLAICSQSVLAAAALVVQAHADVQLPMGHVRPVSDFFVTVAETGARKSASDAEATWPIRKREQALGETRDAELANYVNDKTAWEKARDEAVKRGNGNRATIKAALDALGPAPAPPLEALMTCPEPTFEGLCKLFAVGQPSLGIFATEGGQFVGGHGMSDDAKLRTAAGLSKLWDDGETRRVRSGDGAIMLRGHRLTVHLMAQPDVAGMMLNDRLLADQGLLSRFLITAPDSAAGLRLWHEPKPESGAMLKRYGARILGILEAPQLLAAGKSNELEPRCLTLSSGARGLWIAFADHVERAITPNGALEPVRGLANKLPEHAARLAAILALVDDLGAPEIGAKHMRAGIALAEHYATEALRLFGASRVNSELRLAQRLLDWLLGTWSEPAISMPDIYQRSLNAIGDKATAAKLIAILEDHGWVVRIPEGAVVSGQRRRDAWRVVRGTSK